MQIEREQVQGVGTRQVTAIVEELCGLEIISTQVSRAAAELDEQLSACRDRPIGEITYLILDARYEKVRHGGAIVPCALLTAIGIGPDGKRSVLGCSVQLSEAERRLRDVVARYQKPAPQLAAWLEEIVGELTETRPLVEASAAPASESTPASSETFNVHELRRNAVRWALTATASRSGRALSCAAPSCVSLHLQPRRNSSRTRPPRS